MELAEQLVGEARERRKRRMDSRERLIEGASATAFVVAAVAAAVALPSSRPLDIPVAALLLLGLALASRVRFEVGDYYVIPAQLAVLPILVLLPLPLVPALVAAGVIAANLPEMWSGTWHRERWVSCLSDSWFIVPPVLVLAAFSPEEPGFGDVGMYVAAIAAQLSGDLVFGCIRDKLVNPVPLWESIRPSLETARVDAVLSPIGFVVGVAAVEEPLVLGVLVPLVWLLEVFSQDRRQRYTATLELNRAYRGTVMLLADVVEFDDGYTADHSRSVVELVQAVADEMGVDPNGRQELEFAALLHDVGKISIPKDVLNKPAKLSAAEFELMKTHTIEGQFMLDRVGGVLGRVGEIVRSCHERWDGMGYPDGIAGHEIPFEARIVFTCDAYNAMTTNRPYRAALPQAAAIAELRANAGTQFDPRVVEALVNALLSGFRQHRTADDVRSLLQTVQVQQGMRVPA